MQPLEIKYPPASIKKLIALNSSQCKYYCVVSTRVLRCCVAIIFLITICHSISIAQNLEEISLKKGAKISGSINVNTVGYGASGTPQRRDPFSWFLTGSLTVNLFGYSAPFSFSYSNVNKSYSQPFNQFNFAPQYKWIKLYTGNSSMTFSPYTLSGHMFYGVGTELTPGKWRIAFMYGRLKKAVPFNLSDSTQFNNAAFKRIGYGVKVGYENNGDAVTFNIFTAKDDPSSIPYVLPQNKITPQQNVVISLAFRKKIFSRFFANVEYGISVLNTNILANDAEGDTVNTRGSYNLIKNLLPQNSTNRYFDAVNGGIGYQGKQYTVQLKYERIAPEYQTLGAYYFNNDMRNITVATNMHLLKNKVTISSNIGVQENNLDHARTSTTQRTVGAVNIQFMPTEKWIIGGNYSNFLSYTKVRSQADPFYKNNLDTLNFYQVSRTTSGTLSKTLGTKENPQAIMITTSYQRASNKANNETGIQLSDFMSTNASYSYSIPPANLTLSVAGNMYSNNAAGITTTFFGPSINTTKMFLDKTIRCSYATSYNQTNGNNTPTSPVWNNQVSVSFAPKEKENTLGKNNFSFSLNVLRKLKTIGEQPAFTEITGTLNYAYTF